MQSGNDRQKLPISRRHLVGGAAGLMAAAASAPGWGAERPIKVGMSLTLTGAYSPPAKFELHGYQLLADEVNRAGGLLGRKLKLVYYDDQANPATAVQLYQKLLTDDRVDLLLSPYETDLTSAVAPIVNRARIVMPCLAANTTAFKGQYPFLVQAMTQTSRYMEPVIDLAAHKGYKTIALLVQNTQFPQSLARGVREKAKAAGLRIIFDASYDPSTTDFSALILKVGAKRPDIVIGATYLSDAEGIVRAAKEQNVNAKMFAFSIGPVEPQFNTGLGSAAENIFGTTLWFPSLHTKGNRKFVADYRKAFGGDPDYHAAVAYSSLDVLVRAVRKVGALDQQRILHEIMTIPQDTVAGHFALDKTGIQIGYSSYALQWQHGKQQLVWPADDQTAPPVLPHPAW